MNQPLIWTRDPSTSLRSAQDDDRRFGGEDRNRTYLDTCVTTTVLKTARPPGTLHSPDCGKLPTPNPVKGETGQAIQHPTPNFSRAKRALEYSGLTPLLKAKRRATNYRNERERFAILLS